MPSYILKKELVFRHKNERDSLFQARSAGRIKTLQSYTDLRAWSLQCEENRQYFLDIIFHAGLPVKASSHPESTLTSTDVLRSCNEDEEIAVNEVQEVKTVPQSQQSELSQNEENALEEALQILESANQLLSESFDSSSYCPDYGHDTETSRPKSGAENNKKGTSSRERSQILDDLRRENESLQLRLTRLQKAPRGMHKETELECLRQMVSCLEERVRNLDNKCRQSSEELDCNLQKYIHKIRNENSSVRDYLEFSERLSRRLMSVQNKYLDLANDRNMLRKAADSLETPPTTSPGLSCLENLRNNWEMAKSKVRYLDQINEEQENLELATIFDSSSKSNHPQNYNANRDKTDYGYDTEVNTSHCEPPIFGSDFGCFLGCSVQGSCCHHHCDAENIEHCCYCVSGANSLSHCDLHEDTCPHCNCDSVSSRLRSGLEKKDSRCSINCNAPTRLSGDEKRRKNDGNSRSSDSEKEHLMSRMNVLKDRVNLQEKETQNKISLLGKVITRDKKQISKIKKLLREEQERCRELQMQLQEEMTKRLSEPVDHSRHYHQKLSSEGGKKKHLDPQLKNSKKFQVFFKKKYLSEPDSPSTDDDLILTRVRCTSSGGCAEDDSKMRASIKSLQEGNTSGSTSHNKYDQQSKNSATNHSEEEFD